MLLVDLFLSLLHLVAAQENKQSLGVADSLLLSKGEKLSAVNSKEVAYRLFECFFLFI